MKLSIIIPAYNEEERIRPVLEDYYKTFTKELGKDFEIIIIPNNCSDNTNEVSKEFSKNKDNVNVINIDYYIGKGGAVLMGFNIARGDLIGFTDADESTSSLEYLKLYQNINNYDGIIASRRIDGATIEPKRTFLREVLSFLFNRSVRIILGLKYKDTQCGAKIFKRDLARMFGEKARMKGWTFDAEILYIAKIKNKKILEYPIYWKEVGGSKLFK